MAAVLAGDRDRPVQFSVYSQRSCLFFVIVDKVGPRVCVCTYFCSFLSTSVNLCFCTYLLIVRFLCVENKSVVKYLPRVFLFKFHVFIFHSYLWCLWVYMSSRRRLPDAKTSFCPCYDLFAATVAGCTDTQVRPIMGPSSPLPEIQAIFSPALYPWPWLCPCRPFVNLLNLHQRRFNCPMRWHKRGEGIIT